MSNDGHLAIKRNISSMQVLKTLQKLFEGDYTMSELIELLNENEPKPVFNNSVVSKYINTCRYCGIEIPKIHNKYYVSKVPFGINFSAKELELLQELQDSANDILSKKLNKVFMNFMTILSKFSNREVVRVETETEDITREVFEKAVHDEYKVRLMFKARNIMDCVPISITEHQGRAYFNVYHNGKEKLVAIDRITGLYVLREKFLPVKKDKTVIYTLKGGLAVRYQLRSYEEIIESNLPHSITIKNKNENREVLLSRLARYGELCEIKTPEVRQEMCQMIKDALANYGE